MFDEEGRKIDFGMQVGMPLEGMSIADLNNYVEKLKLEITRVEKTCEELKVHNNAADALFK